MYGVTLRVWGDYACFSRPEMKVERVSYDVMTPSAARGILEAIYYKPALRWVCLLYTSLFEGRPQRAIAQYPGKFAAHGAADRQFAGHGQAGERHDADQGGLV